MDGFGELMRALLFFGILLAAFGWGLARWWRASDDRTALLFRWSLTALDLGFLMFVAVPLVLQGGYTGAFGAFSSAPCISQPPLQPSMKGGIRRNAEEDNGGEPACY